MSTVPHSAALLLAFIRRVETGRNDATAYDTIYGHNQGKLPKLPTQMTVDEIIKAGPGWTRAFRSSACGAYQFMNATLKDLKKSQGLTGAERFTPELQDRLGYALLKRRGYAGFMAGTISRIEFARNLAREWASLPVLVPTRGGSRNVERGQSYYAGDGLNKALISPEEIEVLLKRVRKAEHEPAPAETPAAPKKPAKGGWAFVAAILITVIGFILKATGVL